FNRKFRYLADRFKGLFCVGCGRCSRTCLVKINITDVTNEISEERAGLAVSAETEHS
ncbi:MAG TPA: 4Fe-4S dicluster domain-containing protein, partial [Thermodesulfobacteriota bacterium]|nr:4Fe-4S dicluster domain-containing protein [Thermodesulfobacteriota bacterium]